MEKIYYCHIFAAVFVFSNKVEQKLVIFESYPCFVKFPGFSATTVPPQEQFLRKMLIFGETM
jgi:hypothetical protein